MQQHDSEFGSGQMPPGGGDTGTSQGSGFGGAPGWNPPPTDRKSVGLAVGLSCLPGLGQIYCGFYQRGFVHIVVVAAMISMLNQWQMRNLHPFFGLFLAFFWIYNIIDAGRCAQAVNRAARGGKPIDLPSPPVAFGDSAGSGITLIGIGVLLLGVTAFGWDLWWLVDWWPLVLIVVGARMVLKSRRID